MKDMAKNKPSITPGCEDAAGAGGGVSRPLKLLDFDRHNCCHTVKFTHVARAGPTVPVGRQR